MNGASYLFQFLPLLLGLALMLAIMSLKVSRSKIRVIINKQNGHAGQPPCNLPESRHIIMSYRELGFDETVVNSIREDAFAFCGENNAACWNGYAGRVGSIPQSIYGKMVYDDAIINGILVKRKKGQASDSLLFEKLGYVNALELNRSDLRASGTASKVKLFVPDRRSFAELLLRCDKNSGILLSLMLDYKLEICN